MVLMHPGMSSRVRQKVPRTGGRAVRTAFYLVAMAGFPVILILGHIVFSGIALPIFVASGAAYTCGVVAAGWLMKRDYHHDRLGFCNVVTLSRMVLTASLIMPLAAGIVNGWAVFAVAIVALGLDGVDGWFARREGLVSSFGSRFDMEVDSAFALILSLLSYVSGSAGLLVLVLGLPRYVFAAASLVFPWLNNPMPERLGRKVVCVIQLAALIVLQVPVLGAETTGLLIAVAAIALLWSFGRDVLWLWRKRP